MQVSEITSFLEGAYGVLNQRYFEGELPPVVITIQSSPKAYGHYTPWDSWHDVTSGFREINIGAETLNRPVENTISTLIHEMVHHYCAVNGIKETSRSGTYHNQRFKEQAEKRGLIIDYNSKIGFSVTHPSDELISFIQEQGWQSVSLARQGAYGIGSGANGGDGSAGGGTATGKKKSSTRKYICPVCGCSVRATKEVHISCMDCTTQMVLEEK